MQYDVNLSGRIHCPACRWQYAGGKDSACVFLGNGRSSSVFLLMQASPIPVAMK